ncbi:GDP/GTP exchange factor Sec2 N-terminal [Trinorchestia longiramus]|nr:GDP/GTP exchange factor Sec2 N-terminal [Trinorchestia longiramus]
MGEGISEHGESWHRSVRARVTALKCHVMAAQGLTPEGQVGPAYSADVLLRQPQNANILKQHKNVADIDAYVAAALEGTSLKTTESNSASTNPSTSRVSTDAALHSDQVCLEILHGNASCSTDPENNEIILSNNDDVKLKCGKTIKNPIGSTLCSSVPDNCSTPVISANLDNVNSSNCAVNNNCDSGNFDSDIGCQQRWPWKATFESDNEDENDHHEMNGYMPISGECDETDDPSSSQSAENDGGAPKFGSNVSEMASKGCSENAKEEEENDLKCIEGKSDCSCCTTHRSRLKELQLQLNRQQKEIQSLTNIRTEVENELQELTANLFQEAHKMVSAANQRTACAEKSLKEAQMAVDVLSGEVTALKAMVITSTPATPNAHLHPQLTSHNSSRAAAVNTATLSSDVKTTPAATLLASSGSCTSAPSSISAPSSTGLRLFQRGHKKSPSDFDLKYGRDITPPSSPFKGGLNRPSDSDQRQRSLLDCDAWEVDPTFHREFVSWHQSGDVNPSSTSFMQRVYEEDINLCLNFPNGGLSHAVLRAVQENELFIEELNVRHQHAAATRCVLLEVARFCKYRFRLGLREPYTWYYISQLARNRIIAVCDFLNYLRYIKQGLVKSSIHETYWEVVKLRRQMAVARLGF